MAPGSVTLLGVGPYGMADFILAGEYKLQGQWSEMTNGGHPPPVAVYARNLESFRSYNHDISSVYVLIAFAGGDWGLVPGRQMTQEIVMFPSQGSQPILAAQAGGDPGKFPVSVSAGGKVLARGVSRG